MLLQFDRPNKLVVVPDTETVVTVQEVYDQCRDYEDLPESMAFDLIVDAEGKTDLGGGKLIVLTLFMINGWRIAFEDRAGPGLTVCEVSEGNTVGRVGDKNSTPQHPIAPTANTHVTIAQASTGLAVVSTATATELHEINEGVFGRKLMYPSPDPTAGVPGALELVDRNTLVVIGHKLLWEDPAQTIGYRHRGIGYESELIDGPYVP